MLRQDKRSTTDNPCEQGGQKQATLRNSSCYEDLSHFVNEYHFDTSLLK